MQQKTKKFNQKIKNQVSNCIFLLIFRYLDIRVCHFQRCFCTKYIN